LKNEKAKAVVEGGVLKGKGYESGCYVKPCIYEASNDMVIVQHETFAPILYIMKYKKLEEAIAMQNGVPQGLSSSIMTLNMRDAETFLSHMGSDCGIVELKLVVRLVVKKKPEEDEKVALIAGKHTCAGKPIPSTGVTTCHWHRE
jgi:aldehyde dehydrogenase (NAD+)